MDSTSIRKRSLSALTFLLSSFLGLVVLANLVSKQLHASASNEIDVPALSVVNTTTQDDKTLPENLTEISQVVTNQN
jgi:hypothetical protein